MPSDFEAIQGLWRAVSAVRGDTKTNCVASHYRFSGNRYQLIITSRVEEQPWIEFALDQEASPKRFLQPSATKIVNGVASKTGLKGFYELEGDTLRICWPYAVREPQDFNDKQHTIETLVRDLSPPPKLKDRSGKQPIQDPVLGKVTWNDNYDSWLAQPDLSPGHRVDISCYPDTGQSDAEALAQAREFFLWAREHELEARKLATDTMLDVYNDTWTEGEIITAEEFMRRIKLSCLSISANGRFRDMLYDDADLFAGHTITVLVTEDWKFKRAQLDG